MNSSNSCDKINARQAKKQISNEKKREFSLPANDNGPYHKKTAK